MQILCEKQIYFPLFLEYDEEWLREFQIWDKTMIQTHEDEMLEVLMEGLNLTSKDAES